MLGKKALAAKVDPEGPSPPFEVVYFWGWFHEILYGLMPGFGPAVVTWGEILAWSSLMGVALEPWESQTLARLGMLRAGVLSDRADKEAKAKRSDGKRLGRRQI